MPNTREQMNTLLGKMRAAVVTWEKAQFGSRREQEAAEDATRTMSEIDAAMCEGAELPAEWIPADTEEVRQWPRNQAQRYLEARYGEGWVYRDPDSYVNVLERWLWAVASGNERVAEDAMLTIEEGLKQDHAMKATEERRRT